MKEGLNQNDTASRASLPLDEDGEEENWYGDIDFDGSTCDDGSEGSNTMTDLKTDEATKNRLYEKARMHGVVRGSKMSTKEKNLWKIAAKSHYAENGLELPPSKIHDHLLTKKRRNDIRNVREIVAARGLDTVGTIRELRRRYNESIQEEQAREKAEQTLKILRDRGVLGAGEDGDNLDTRRMRHMLIESVAKGSD